MNRQYLKQLKDRAEKLLQLSNDDQQDEDINAYTATQGDNRSQRKIQIGDVFLQDEDPEEAFEIYEKNTDIQMLKRCIALTNENANLKFLVQKLSAQVQSLKEDLKGKSNIESELRLKLQLKQGNKQQEMINLQKIRQSLEDQRKDLELKKQTIENQKILLKKEQDRQAKTRRQGVRDSRDVQIYHDYTIKTGRNEEIQRLKVRNIQLEKRLRRSQQILRQQRSKSVRLCKFISKQIPSLNNIIIELTAKLDAKFQKHILKTMIHGQYC